MTMRYRLCIPVLLGFLILVSCEEEEKSNPKYLEFTLDGEYHFYSGEDNTYYFGEGRSCGHCQGNDTIFLGFSTSYDGHTYSDNPSLKIKIYTTTTRDKLDSNGCAFRNDQHFRKLFFPGRTETEPVHRKSVGEGVEIQYVDENGEYWSTRYEPDPNEDFYYHILSSRDYGIHPLIAEILVEAEFHCTLFNEAGDSIKLKAGMMCSTYRHF